MIASRMILAGVTPVIYGSRASNEYRTTENDPEKINDELLKAAESGETNVVWILLDAGADVDARNQEGATHGMVLAYD